MKKILFITILFGAMLVGGVVYAEDGECRCNKVDEKTGVVTYLNELIVGVNGETDCASEEGEKGSTGGFYIFADCYWTPTTPKPASKPKSQSGSGSSATAGTGAISATPLGEPVKLDNPLGEGRTDVRAILGDIIKYAMGILGSLTLLVFVYGGFLWLISAGNPENVKKGMQTMLWAVIGIFIIFASYGILTLVFNAIGATKKADAPWGAQ